MQRRCLFLGIAGLLLAAATGFSVAEAQSAYLGYKKCYGCHKSEYDAWKGGIKKNAFEPLMPGARKSAKESAGLDVNKDYTADPKCLQCHATGYGQPGGFVSYQKTPDLAGVTCEACHGPGSDFWLVMAKSRLLYKRMDLIVKGLTPPNQATCDKCHHGGDNRCPTVAEDHSMSYEPSIAHENTPLKGTH